MEKKVEKNNNLNKFFIGAIIFFAIVILVCGAYLINSFRLIKKYNVDSFKFHDVEIVTFNNNFKSKFKLVSASEKDDKVTLKYDIKNIKMNDILRYFEKLSARGYTVVRIEDTYMRVVNYNDNVQVKIKVGSNHLVFEYRIGIEENPIEESEKEETKDDETNKVDTSEGEWLCSFY